VAGRIDRQQALLDPVALVMVSSALTNVVVVKLSDEIAMANCVSEALPPVAITKSKLA
jgi:hypothetical protein